MTPALDRIDHVALSVTDIDRAIAWYQQHFSVALLYRDPTWALLGFANLRLALVLPGQHPPHLCIPRTDAAAFGDLRPHRDGTRSVYIQDSEGNHVEILAQD